MFDVYIQEQSIDPRLRNRMMAAMTTAAALTVCAGIVAWGADKLQISGVAAPNRFDVVTLGQQMEPPPPPAPPARPESQKAAVSDGPTRDRAPEREPDSADQFLEDSRPSSNRGPIGKDEGGGDGDGPKDRGPLGPTTGSPCLIGMNCTSVVGSDHTRPEPKAERVADVPFDAMKAIYAPDPTQTELARTRTGLGARRPGKVRVEFCIDARGKVSSSRIAKRFPGDADIDAIARSTVAKWRFKPMLVDGRPKAACSAVTFDIRFD